MKTFETVSIGSMSLSNRLLMAPVKTGFGGLDGTISEQMLAYYRSRAEGGVGAIIVEPLFVDRLGKEHPRQLAIDTDDAVDGLLQLVAVIHDGGARAIAHLNHAGRAANPKATGQVPEAPSEVACPTTGAMPQALDRVRIGSLVRSFGAAARRAREAGFDAVEVQCGLGYLIAQFLSKRTNKRTDSYGGGQDQRDRFAREVIQSVREALTQEMPVIARISASEQVDGGLTVDDAVSVSHALSDWGVSAIHVVTGSACDTPPWYYQHMGLPEGINEQLASKIKASIKVPTIVAGRLGDPDRIAELLRREQVDMVALGRPLVADPDMPRKMLEGRNDEIVFCGHCLQGCLANVKAGKGLGCIANPEVGHEGDISGRAEAVRHVVVVGGGPAGMTAAIAARRRGYRVTLLERNELGGQFTLAPLAPGKEAMARPLESMRRLASKSGAKIRTGVEATVELVEILEPDVVVLATGAEPATLPIAGLEDALTSNDVLADAVETGSRVLIVGGGMVGIEVAEFLATKGKSVTVIELLGDVARDMLPITRKLTLNRLQKLQVEIFTDTELERMASGKARVTGPSGKKELGPFDSVVVAVGTKSNHELAAPLMDRGLEVHVVGDAAELKQIIGAVQSAWEVACRI